MQIGGDAFRFRRVSIISHHGSEPDSTLVVEAARQVVVPRHVKLATHIGAEDNSFALAAA